MLIALHGAFLKHMVDESILILNIDTYEQCHGASEDPQDGLPWKILNSHLDSVSVGEYYSNTIIINLPQEKERLFPSKGLLKKSKDALFFQGNHKLSRKKIAQKPPHSRAGYLVDHAGSLYFNFDQIG